MGGQIYYCTLKGSRESRAFVKGGAKSHIVMDDYVLVQLFFYSNPIHRPIG